MKKNAIAVLGVACFVSGAFITKVAKDKITLDVLQDAQKLIGLHFTSAQLVSTLSEMEEFKESYEAIRKVLLTSDAAPALVFSLIQVKYCFG